VLIFLKSVLSFDPDFVPDQIRTNYLTAKNNDLLISVQPRAVLYAPILLPLMGKCAMSHGSLFRITRFISLISISPT
jgi:hypothetical protein